MKLKQFFMPIAVTVLTVLIADGLGLSDRGLAILLALVAMNFIYLRHHQEA